MGRELSPVLGAEPEPARRLPFQIAYQGDKKTCSQKQTLKLQSLCLPIGRFVSRAFSSARATCSLKRGRGSSTSGSGGGAMAQVSPSAKSTFALEEPGTSSCVCRTAAIIPFRGVYREIVHGERLIYTECYDVP